METPTALPDAATCDAARRSRDPRFDGLFHTAVHSTRIYCRPVCPAPFAKSVTYYPSAAAAEAAGYRPCLRCRPELSPADGCWHRGDATVARALRLIDDGLLDDAPVAALAARVAVGERQLRRLFVERLGATPSAVHGTRRLLFAKQLLTETSLPVTRVALAAGFGSVRRFNHVFAGAYRMAPRDLRRTQRATTAASGDDVLVLRLGYRPPCDFAAMLAFLRGRALPGIESVDATSYARVLGDETDRADGWLRVSAWPGGVPALKLELRVGQAHRLQAIVARVRRMFDLDADPATIAATLARDARLAPLLQAHPGLRLPSGWDGFEIAIRAVLGQQVSVAVARTLATRLVARFGRACPAGTMPPGLTHAFPRPDALADADFASLGLTRARASTVHAVARALLDGRVDFRVDRRLDDFVAQWTSLPGIGPWTAQYVAMRALGHPDAFPADDLVLQKAVPVDGNRSSARALSARAEAWRPWRAYAVVHLWRDAMATATTTSTSPDIVRAPARGRMRAAPDPAAVACVAPAPAKARRGHPDPSA